MAGGSDTFRVERSAVIAAPAERIYPAIADLHRWLEWSPFDKFDPAMRRTYGGAASGVGATYAWEGAGRAGAGQMEIIDASDPSRVAIKLNFTKPFKATNESVFTLEPIGADTRVTWAMTGAHSLMSRVMGLFMSMDKTVGKEFEEGLRSLKALTEASGG